MNPHSHPTSTPTTPIRGVYYSSANSASGQPSATNSPSVKRLVLPPKGFHQLISSPSDSHSHSHSQPLAASIASPRVPSSPEDLSFAVEHVSIASKKKSKSKSTNKSSSKSSSSTSSSSSSLRSPSVYPVSTVDSGEIHDPTEKSQYLKLQEEHRALESKLHSLRQCLDTLNEEYSLNRERLLSERRWRWETQVKNKALEWKVKELERKIEEKTHWEWREEINRWVEKELEKVVAVGLEKWRNGGNNNSSGSVSTAAAQDGSAVHDFVAPTSPAPASNSSITTSTSHPSLALNQAAVNPTSSPAPSSAAASSSTAPSQSIGEFLSRSRLALSDALRSPPRQRDGEITRLFTELLSAQEYYMETTRKRGKEIGELRGEILRYQKEFEFHHSNEVIQKDEKQKLFEKILCLEVELNELKGGITIVEQHRVQERVEFEDELLRVQKESEERRQAMHSLQEQLTMREKSLNQMAKRVYYYKSRLDSFELPVRKFEVEKVLSNGPNCNAQLLVKKIPTTGELFLAVQSPDLELEVQSHIECVRIRPLDGNGGGGSAAGGKRIGKSVGGIKMETTSDVLIEEEEVAQIGLEEEEEEFEPEKFLNSPSGPSNQESRAKSAVEAFTVLPGTNSGQPRSRFLLTFEDLSTLPPSFVHSLGAANPASPSQPPKLTIIFECSPQMREEIISELREFQDEAPIGLQGN